VLGEDLVGVYWVQNSSIYERGIKFFEAKLQLVRYEPLIYAGRQRLTVNHRHPSWIAAFGQVPGELIGGGGYLRQDWPVVVRDL
jgi:hypothetical protein